MADTYRETQIAALSRRHETAERRREVVARIPRHPAGRFLGRGETAPGPWIPKSTFHSRAHAVYFIRCADFIKIGMSHDRRKRLDALRGSLPFSFVPLGWISCVSRESALCLESKLHWQWMKSRQCGEWFKATPELLAFIAEKAKAWECQ